MRVLITGDSPLITTGFGRVNARVAKRLQSEGHEVASVAGLTKEAPKDDEGIKIYVPSRPNDVLGIMDIQGAVNDFKPDVVYMTADPGSVTVMAMGTPDMPAFIYTPVEGEPIVNQDWKTILTTVNGATVSQYGANVISRELGREMPWYYHGVDHDTFNVSGIGDYIRKRYRWEDKFVITCVSTNVRRKQIPRLIEAVAKLKHIYKQKDIILYLHTVPFQNYWLEGWNLIEIVRMYDVEDITFFHPFMKEFNSSVSVRTDDDRNPGLVEMYNASNLFVLPSQVEGFGLPIAEAMACGVPVLVTRYAAGWEVASPAGRGIPVGDWEVHKSGTVYANVSVDALAKEILRLKRNPKELKRMSDAGLKRAQDFNWQPFENDLVSNLENAINAYQTSRPDTQEEDSSGQQGSQDEADQVPAGEVSSEEAVPKDNLLSKGKSKVIHG